MIRSLSALALALVLGACGGSVESQSSPPKASPSHDAGAVHDNGSKPPSDLPPTHPPIEPDAAPPNVEDTSPIVDTTPPPPAPSSPPPYPSYSKGTCPKLVSGATAATSENLAFPSGSDKRAFRLLVPKSYDGSSEWALMFGWHWLNASSGSFIRDGELETAAEEMKFIIVLPDNLEDASGKKAYQFNWPFAEAWGQEKELLFIDDLLACVSTQFKIDKHRVYGVGVSAGALWATFLSTTDRAKYFAAFESLSGGLGSEPFGAWKMTYVPQPNKFASLVLWGGSSDWMILNFDESSRRYRDALLADDHFVVTCTHDKGHALPPVDKPEDGGTRFRPIWQFLLDHPYGTGTATTPYAKTGLPKGYPSWCNIPKSTAKK